MDNTELHYVTYDPDAIWQDMVSAYMENGGDAIKPGEEVDVILRSVLAIMMQSFAGVDNALRMSTLRYAVGQYLDMIGENRYCYRKEATRAVWDAKIMGAYNTVIPAGTQVTYDGATIYETTETVVMPEVGEIETQIECTTAGIAGNANITGLTLSLLDPMDGVEGVTVIGLSEQGVDREDDEAYRERIRRFGMSNITTGTKMSYENMAMSVEGVANARAMSTKQDSVSSSSPGVAIRFVEKDGYDPEVLIEKIRDKILNEKTRPFANSVSVSYVTKQTYTAYIHIDVLSKSKSGVIEANVNEWLKWSNIQIAEVFVVNRLLAVVYSAGANNVSITNSAGEPMADLPAGTLTLNVVKPVFVYDL